MKLLVVFISCIASWITLTKCKRQDPCEREGYETPQKCLSDGSGFEKCERVKYSVYTLKTVKCSKPQSACSCFENNDYRYVCECINPRTPPKFPPTGVIRWNATTRYDDNWWVHYEHPRETDIPGEIHKDSNGRYLMKETKVVWPRGDLSASKTVKFEIIIPNEDGETFTKYNGDDRSTICTKSEVYYEGSLTSIWTKRNSKYYLPINLVTETQKESNIFTQLWKQVEWGDDWGKFWEWTIEYNTEKDYAIPIKYFHKVEDGFVGTYDGTVLHYTYEPIEKDEESFQLEDYCNDVKK